MKKQNVTVLVEDGEMPRYALELAAKSVETAWKNEGKCISVHAGYRARMINGTVEVIAFTQVIMSDLTPIEAVAKLYREIVDELNDLYFDCLVDTQRNQFVEETVSDMIGRLKELQRGEL